MYQISYKIGKNDGKAEKSWQGQPTGSFGLAVFEIKDFISCKLHIVDKSLLNGLMYMLTCCGSITVSPQTNAPVLYFQSSSSFRLNPILLLGAAGGLTNCFSA